jgi:hypothetical protein
MYGFPARQTDTSVQGQAGKARQERISAVVYPKADMVHEFT